MNNGYFCERQSHERVRAQTLLEKMNLVIKDRRLRWLGHVLRMDDNEKSCTIMIIIIKIITTMFMVLSSWKSHCESSPGSFDECRIAPSGRRPKTKPDDLGCESACTGCQKLYPPSPFYRPTEGRRLSRSNPVFKLTPFSDAKYLTNGYRYGHSYYRRRIGNRTQAFKWHQFK